MELSFKHNPLTQNKNKAVSKYQFITADIRIKNMLSIIQQTANSDSTILITGESGTGKEVLAHVIHQSGDRYNKPMISLNCGAIPENLIESELFGYEKGAFTGASRDGQQGKFELADGGILFLDEIGEMSLAAQTRLLRVLQDKTIRKVGGKTDIMVDVKIICATNQNLLQLVNEKRFRADLYYRINVIPFNLPPLRERKSDISLLTHEFLHYFNHKFDKKIMINHDVLNKLIAYSWPGNVRELKNAIEYLANIKSNGFIQFDDLPHYITSQKNRVCDTQNELNGSLKTTIKQQESQILHSLILNARSTAEKRQLASELGISISSLYRKVSEYKLAQRE